MPYLRLNFALNKRYRKSNKKSQLSLNNIIWIIRLCYINSVNGYSMYIHVKALKRLTYFSLFPCDIDSVRAIQSDLPICDYQSRFTAIHFIQFARRRTLLKRIFPIRHTTNYITRTEIEAKTEWSGSFAVSNWFEKTNPPVSLTYLESAKELVLSPQNKKKEPRLISQTKRRESA